MKKLSAALAAVAIAALFFSGGYFAGRAAGGDVNVTVSSEPPKTQRTEYKVNINLASKDELLSVRGIGETLAGRIIEYREKKGGFFSTEDIKKVNGITDAVYEKIKDHITI